MWLVRRKMIVEAIYSTENDRKNAHHEHCLHNTDTPICSKQLNTVNKRGVLEGCHSSSHQSKLTSYISDEKQASGQNITNQPFGKENIIQRFFIL